MTSVQSKLTVIVQREIDTMLMFAVTLEVSVNIHGLSGMVFSSFS